MTYSYKWKVPALKVPAGYLTLRQAGAMLGMSTHVIAKIVDRGEISKACLPGSHRVFVTMKSVRRYAEWKGIQLKEST